MRGGDTTSVKTWRGRISGGKVEESRLYGLELVPTRPWGGRTDRGDAGGAWTRVSGNVEVPRMLANLRG